MNYAYTIPSSIRKTAALLAIIALAVTSMPLVAHAATLFGPASATIDNVTTSYASGAINASGHQNLVLSFSYDAEDLDSGDSFAYGWRQVSGSNNELGTVSGVAEVGTTTPTDEIGSVSMPLPAGAQISDLEIYMTATVDSGSDSVNLTNIQVTGDLVPVVVEENAVCDVNCEYTTLADAVAGENAGETITLKSQTHTITNGISIDKALTIVGEAGSVIETSGGNVILNITADGVVLDSLTIEKTDSTTQNIIQIGANNVTIQNSSFSGTYVLGDGQTSRAFVVVGGKTGLLITNNSFTNIRQPAYINNTVSGNITDNYVSDTRGWVIVSDTNLTFTGNTWGNNAVDIAIISQSGSVNNYTCEMVKQMSTDNNNAVIDNQVQSPACPIDPVAPPTVPTLSGEVIYDAIPDVLPSSYPSLGFQATQTYEFGDELTFAPGTGRDLESAAITLTSWACQSGQWNSGTCKTVPGATFSHPITLNIYEVATGGGVGVLIDSITDTFDIPYRPSADSSCTDINQWKDTNGGCFNGLNHVIVFDLSGVTVPDSVVFGVAFNTQTYGASPVGSDGPYNSLNVALNTDSSVAPYIGTDVEDDVMYRNQNNTGYEKETGWSGYRLAVTFTAVEPTPPATDDNDSDRSSASGGYVGGSSGPTPQVLGASTDQEEMLALLNAIEARLYELLAERNASPTWTPTVSGASVSTGGTSTGTTEEEVVEEDEGDSTSTPVTIPDDEEDEEEDEDSETEVPWAWIAWGLVALWLLASAGAYWHRSQNPGSTYMRIVQAVFGVIGLGLLIAFFLFGLAGALFWPTLILAVGAITAYFWTLE